MIDKNTFISAEDWSSDISLANSLLNMENLDSNDRNILMKAIFILDNMKFSNNDKIAAIHHIRMIDDRYHKSKRLDRSVLDEEVAVIRKHK